MYRSAKKVVRGAPAVLALDETQDLAVFPGLAKGGRVDRPMRQSRVVVGPTKLQRADLQSGLLPHTFQHSFATHLLESGADPKNHSGHARALQDWDAAVYLHLSQRHLQAVVNPSGSVTRRRPKRSGSSHRSVSRVGTNREEVMKRPPFEVADIIRAAGKDFIEKQRSGLTGLHLKVLSAIERCRTAALGGHRDRCSRCGHTAAISYNSCRNRHCPKCQTNARDKWLAVVPENFCRSPVCMWSSRFRTRWLLWPSTTRSFCIPSCFEPALRLCWRLPPIRNIWARRSASSACSTLGARTCCTTRTSIA